MTLPTRNDLQQRRAWTQMLDLVRDHIQQDQPNAISDEAYFARSNLIIKTLVEEYEPFAHYVRSIDKNGRLTACLSASGAATDGEIWENDQVKETIQIVHGTANYSEALKREALKNGEIVFANSEYQRNRQTRAPEESCAQMSPRELAEDTAASIIIQIEKKAAKKYTAIDTLLVAYDETMSTPSTNSNQVVVDTIDSWLKKQSSANLMPFKKIVIVSNHGHTRLWSI